MGALDVIRLLLAGDAGWSAVRLTDWTVSQDGVRAGPVTAGALGIRDGETLWFKTTFTAEGAAHVLEAERPLTGPGAATVVLDGALQAGAKMTLAKHLRCCPPELRCEIDVVLTGSRYRFDARVI